VYLPHPENKHTTKGLGTNAKFEEAAEEITKNEETHKLELLFCNDIPVFQSVSIGTVFALTEGSGKSGFWSETTRFLNNIINLPSLSHQPFSFTSGEEKIINTSALGIVVVEHQLSSVISKRLILKSSINDGMFHVLILSPQNVFEILSFLMRSLLPAPREVKKLPTFIGQIKASNLNIGSSAEISFTVDGKKASAKEISLHVEHEALQLKHSSIYHFVRDGAEEKKIIKTDRLPTGEKRNELAKRKLPILPRATTEEFQELFKVLRKKARATPEFNVMMVLATLIATFGLFADSSPVIIGAMILAPIISPIVSFSMGMVRYDVNMLKAGIITILIGTIGSLIFAAGVSIIIPLKVITSEIDARLSPTLLDLGIAVVSGIAAAYAHAKEGIAKSLAGVAIAVALVPPLAVAGIGIGWMDWEVFSGAFLLYLTNLSGIIMFAGLTFLLMGFAPFKRARLGLVYTFIIIILVMVPLSISFNRIQEEANVSRQLEEIKFDEIILRDVQVRLGEPLRISVKIVGPRNLLPTEMQEIKRKIEEEIGQPINLEVVSALEF
jgi:uncharacterized hydrophobic protein (TIGR00271 family)